MACGELADHDLPEYLSIVRASAQLLNLLSGASVKHPYQGTLQ